MKFDNIVLYEKNQTRVLRKNERPAVSNVACIKLEPAFVINNTLAKVQLKLSDCQVLWEKTFYISRETLAIFIPCYSPVPGEMSVNVDVDGAMPYEILIQVRGTATLLEAASWCALNETTFLRRRQELQSLPFDLMLHEASRHADICVRSLIMITGSVGKTSTKEVLAEALKDTCVVKSTDSWNFPHELCAFIVQHGDIAEDIVLEASVCPHLKELSQALKPKVVVFTHLGFAHTGTIEGLKEIALKKMGLLAGLKPDGAVIYNADVKYLSNHVESAIKLYKNTSRVFAVTTKNTSEGNVHFDILQVGDSWRLKLISSIPFLKDFCGEEFSVPLSVQPINAALAYCSYRAIGKNSKFEINTGLFTVPFRFEMVNLGPLLFINDAYNANPISMSAFLSLFKNTTSSRKHTVLVLGEMLELGEAFEKAHVDALNLAIAAAGKVIAFGEAYKSAALLLNVKENQVTVVSSLTHLQNKVDEIIKNVDAIGFKGSYKTGILTVAIRTFKKLRIDADL
jgi:UDP-N-acetylmuramyl pentapeptide synthase